MPPPSAKLHLLFLVYDLVAESVSGPIITFPSDAVAVRTFSDAVLAPNSILSAHAKDFELRQVGVIDLNTGIIAPLEQHRTILSAQAVLDIANRDQSALPLFPEASNG